MTMNVSNISLLKRIAVFTLILSGCGSGSQSDGSAAGNTLTYGELTKTLSYGFEETYRFRPDQGNDTHRNRTFHVSDAPFRETIISGTLSGDVVVWRPDNASVWLRADFYSPGGEEFDSAVFEYEPSTTDVDGPLVAGRFFFNDGRLGIDLNGDNRIDTDNAEFVDIADGTIEVSRTSSSQARIDVDVTTAAGVVVKGQFGGEFVVYDGF